MAGLAEAGGDRRALRIALAMALAITLAELDPDLVQLSFLAPLCAAVIAAGPAAPVAALLVLPPLAWALCFATGLALQLLQGMPLALAVLLFAAFRAGFRASEEPRLAVPGVLLLIIASVLPMVLITEPALAEDAARWISLNVAIAVLSALLVHALLPDPPGEPAPVGPRLAPLPPSAAAAALLVAMALVALIRPEAKGALLISVVVSLRADGSPPGHAMRIRLGAAVIGGAAAWLAWQVIGLAPSLPVLFTLVLLIGWVLARRFTAGGPESGIWLKSLNAFAILLGEGFSVFFEEADDRFGIRLGAVVLGLLYAAMALWLLAPRQALRGAPA